VRIVSLLPSATEIVCALGARDELLGRSAECDYPAGVTELPVVMRAKTLDGDRPSAEIDARVRRMRGIGESLYELDLPLLRTLRPDLIFTQDLCGVCSVTGEEVVAACTAAGVEPEIVALSPKTLDEVWTTVETVGDAIGRPVNALRLASALRRRASATPGSAPARVAVVEWLDPPILAGLWTPSMVAAAGGVALGPAPGQPGKRTTWPEVASLRADLLVLSPCSFSVERTRSELRDRSLAAEVAKAAPAARTYLADEAYFSRPGPRLADGIELLRSLLKGVEGPFPLPVARFGGSLGEVAA